MYHKHDHKHEHKHGAEKTGKEVSKLLKKPQKNEAKNTEAIEGSGNSLTEFFKILHDRLGEPKRRTERTKSINPWDVTDEQSNGQIYSPAFAQKK